MKFDGRQNSETFALRQADSIDDLQDTWLLRKPILCDVVSEVVSAVNMHFRAYKLNVYAPSLRFCRQLTLFWPMTLSAEINLHATFRLAYS